MAKAQHNPASQSQPRPRDVSPSVEAALRHRQGGNENPAGLPSVLSVLLATRQVLDPLWASGCATCAGSESRSGLVALALGQQHLPRVERPAAAGQPVLWRTGCRSLVYSGRGPGPRPGLQDRELRCRPGVGVGSSLLQGSWLLLGEGQVIGVLLWGIQ